jgi:archaetidylinositol phosphate synthase
MKESVRERAALTAAVERRVLQALARRMPAPVHSDHLTILGVLAALGVGAGYALSGLSPHWLWLASVMLVVNWFGDSLDGTLARVRSAQRPRYGYYLDHAVDAFTTAVIGVGIGLSPFISLYVGLAVVILYLMMSINVYLESTVYEVFRMDYGVVGPTEARILLIIGNGLLVWATAGLGIAPARIEPVASVTVAVLVGVMGALLVWRFAGNLRTLARAEPLDRGEPRNGNPGATGTRPPTDPAGREPSHAGSANGDR